jgi:hypothetical protein
MLQKQCRLSLVDKFFGGSGGGGAPNPNITPELRNIYKGFNTQTVPTFNNFVQGQPLLSTAQGGALDFFNQISPVLQQTFGSQISPVLESGGALTAEQGRDVTQATRAAFAARGNIGGNQAIGAELLNRDQYRQQRFNQALGQAGQIQGLETGGLNQLTGVEQAETSSFATLANPLYGLFENAQNAATQLQIASENKNAGLAGGAISSIGSIAGAAIGASDERLKENILDTGETTPEGIPIKTFTFYTDPNKVRYIGVMAQDVEKVDPSNVITDPVSGIKFVPPKYFPKSV